MAFPLAAAAVIGGSQIAGGLISGNIAAGGAQDAANIQEAGLTAATGAQKKAGKQARRAVSAFRTAGNAAVGGLADQATQEGLDPTTQLNIERDTRTLNRQLAASGKTRSGEGIERFSEGVLQKNLLADQALKTGRLDALANLGLIQAGTTSAAALRKGQNISNLLLTQAGIQGNAAQTRATNKGSLAGGLISTAGTFGALSLLGGA